MADMVFAPTFADLDAEREVVLEEIAMVEDTPQDLVHDLLAEAVFGTHALGRPVIGRAGVISSVSKRSLAAYRRQMYRAGNIVVSAAGISSTIIWCRCSSALLTSVSSRRKPVRRCGSRW